MNITPATHTVDLNKYFISLSMRSLFVAEVSRRICKRQTRSCATAQVRLDRGLDEIVLEWNPDWFATLVREEKDPHTDEIKIVECPDKIMFVLLHEFFHIIFGHLSGPSRKPNHKTWNIATDLAINSVIFAESRDNPAVLPDGIMLPGWWPGSKDGKMPAGTDPLAFPVSNWIATAPRGRASEWYFQQLMLLQDQIAQANGGKSDDEEQNASSSTDGGTTGDNEGSDGEQHKSNAGGGSGSDTDDAGNDRPEHGYGLDGKTPRDPRDVELRPHDEHDCWDDLSQEEKDRIGHRVRDIVKRAVDAANQSSSGWGNIPAEVKNDIIAAVNNLVPWRHVLKQFLGTLLPGNRTTSIKKINKRYPMIHPGIKRGRVPKLLIAIDQSGSVSNELLTEFFAFMTGFVKKIEIDTVHFDYTCDPPRTWRRGSTPECTRTRAGGTCFDAPTALFNAPENRGKWDGLLILTDGEAPKPEACRGRRGWLLGHGNRLAFSTDEFCLEISNAPVFQGAWR